MNRRFLNMIRPRLQAGDHVCSGGLYFSEDSSGMDSNLDIPPERLGGAGSGETSFQWRGPSIASDASRAEDKSSQIAAVEALSRWKDSSRRNQLRKAATHQGPQVRMAAIEAIGSLEREGGEKKTEWRGTSLRSTQK